MVMYWMLSTATRLQTTVSRSTTAIFTKVINIKYLRWRRKKSMQSYVIFVCQVGMSLKFYI